MNHDDLGNQIRSSAKGQGGRYRPADDLIPRIENRRRQRAARRMTASGVAAVVLVGGGALAMTTLRDRGNDTHIADSTVVSVEDTVTTPSTTAVTPTTLNEPPTTVTTTTVPVTTVPATVAGGTDTPQLNVPEPTAPSDANVPMPTADPDRQIGVSEFWNVPSYGSEPVRGSGCGSGGQLGDTIPDGLWAGFIVDDGGDGLVGIDLLCIYHGTAGQSMLTSGTGTLLTTTPEYLIVNNSTRARFMPMDATISLRLSARDGAGRCVESRSTTHWADIPPDRQVWIRIHGGRITWILADCPPQ